MMMVATRRFLRAPSLCQRILGSGRPSFETFATVAVTTLGQPAHLSFPETTPRPLQLERVSSSFEQFGPHAALKRKFHHSTIANLSADTSSSGNSGSSTISNDDSDSAEWQSYYAQLLAYVQEFGDPHVPIGLRHIKTRDELGISHDLAKWVTQQRKALPKKKGAKAALRRAQLDEIGFEWFTREAAFKRSYNLAVKWREDNGVDDINILGSLEMRCHHLGRFLERQRMLYRKGSTFMTAERVEMLENLGVVFDPRKKKWADKFSKLKEFEREQGSVTDFETVTDDKALLNWVNKQRQKEFGSDKVRMTPERRKKLESLKGWRWTENSPDPKWEENFSSFRRQVSQFGLLNLSTQNHEVWMWLIRQRRLFVEGKMSRYRVEKLNEVDPSWAETMKFHQQKYHHPELRAAAEEHSITGTSRHHLWDLKYAAYRDFLNKSASTEPSPILQRWAKVQRTLYNQGKLDKARIKLLEEINFPMTTPPH